ncbi:MULTISPECIES: hypothetical protein [Ralstonia solanacearum species complex]|uniref:Transmembrane protein n=1 Tax=Ralstonia syzygii TaxID=28097 RepID=A0ABX7ZKZ5_9RALS|nr:MULTISPECIES: hypothetical protein [Ralstonia solanacearum species complex]BEU74085.1 hypothetical protein MAFF211271_36400 [Ralstonia pseudosolanacearum]AMP39544.1 hypothetical protein LBM2029_18255 [Ralstonia solanacearum]AXV78985.1 hypothetical protein CJO76_18520 [Ralstonia solanacearum]AXV88383.1 hypothetical protein CJO78_18780 [Ralstonia solanacearum]AXV93004.1 hypothetical protein CJO79_18505 [Ralstonia solanacearum]
MSAPIPSPSLLPARAFARGKRLRGVRWIMMVWCLLFTVSVFSATHFPDGQAAGDAFDAIEAVVDDALGDALQPAVSNTVFERALDGAAGKLPGQCADSHPWFAKASAAPDAPSSSNAVTSDPASDAPELWLPPPALPLAPALRVARARPAFPPFRPGPAPAPMLRPPAHA